MNKFNSPFAGSALTAFLILGSMSAAAVAGDLSRYREFQLGSDLSTVSKQIGVSPSQAKVIHKRPALIQELNWRPQPLGASSDTEPVQEVIFSFHEGQLFRIDVNYDRYQTEGLTSADIVAAISATYGMAVQPLAPLPSEQGRYGDQEEILAQWQDAEYSYRLARSSYGPSYMLIGVSKKLDTQAQAAILAAVKLDDQEAPQRDAAMLASEAAIAKAKLNKARLVNKPNFKP
jgi:hypothetical protein